VTLSGPQAWRGSFLLINEVPTADSEMAGFITHFEIYGEEPSKLADFYQRLLGWEIERPAGIDYWRIRTDPKNGRAFDGGLTHSHSPACGIGCSTSRLNRWTR
jgi:predicted enzyme related to lactoylglutathione lyase